MVSDSTRFGAAVLLLAVGVPFLLFTGAALAAEGTTPLRPPALVGFALPFVAALAAARLAGRFDDPEAWGWETRRGRAVLLATAGLVLLARFGLASLPPAAKRTLLACVFGASAGAVLLGAGNLLRRALEA